MWLAALGLGPQRARALSYLDGQTDVTRRDGYLDALVASRRALVAANAMALGGLVWLAWGLLGPGPALLGGLLMVLDPFLGAHSRLVHLDALLASFMGLAALAGLAFWSGRSWGYLVACALFSGLAFLTKAPSVYLLAFVPSLAIFEKARADGWRRRAGWARVAIGVAAWLGVAGLVCLALWPALRLKPLVVLRQMIEFTAKNGGGEHDNFFLGQPVEDPGPLFYPLALLFRATPLMLLGLALLAYFMVRRRNQLASCWPALLLAGYVAGFGLMMTLGEKKFDRYELPVFPVLDLLAGLGLWVALCSLPHGVATVAASPRRRVAASALALALAAWPLASVYPYDLAYYNPLLGGGPAAQRALFVGWGEGMDRVAAYLNARPIVLQAPAVATAYHRVLQAHLSGNGAMPLERAELADYIVPYVNSIQRDQKAEVLAGHLAGQEPEYVVWLNGIEYARVYRGPHFPSDRTLGAQFGQQLQLESAVFAPGSGLARAGDDLLARLRWRPLVGADSLASVLRLLGPDGRVTLQDRQPLARALRQDGLLVVEVQLHLPPGLQPGQYQLQALADDPRTGRPLTLPDNQAALTIQQVMVQPAVAR
jgi:4-amino-4-deoxy-L-arabinose transferase-like glycosyltransferase